MYRKSSFTLSHLLSTPAYFFSHFLSLSHTHTLSLSLTHTHTHTLSLSLHPSPFSTLSLFSPFRSSFASLFSPLSRLPPLSLLSHTLPHSSPLLYTMMYMVYSFHFSLYVSLACRLHVYILELYRFTLMA